MVGGKVQLSFSIALRGGYLVSLSMVPSDFTHSNWSKMFISTLPYQLKCRKKLFFEIHQQKFDFEISKYHTTL